jgi:hypothetical protein
VVEVSEQPNVLALTWIDEHLALEQDYRRLWRHYTELQRAYLYLLLQLREERELRAWAAGEIETRFPESEAAA